uniref:Uncharacterized protein n=1 Tax=Anguilla anguilla TaxID=7936 RepID=A0A0E9QRC6_ANGAN
MNIHHWPLPPLSCPHLHHHTGLFFHVEPQAWAGMFWPE